MTQGVSTPHLPQRAAIDSYGNGGFRFAGMSHRGSLLCLPSGIWAWPVTTVDDIDDAAFARLFAEAATVDFFILGSGDRSWPLPEPLRWRFREHSIRVEVMTTGAAVRTYNIVLGEKRLAAAGLIAIATDGVAQSQPRRSP